MAAGFQFGSVKAREYSGGMQSGKPAAKTL